MTNELVVIDAGVESVERAEKMFELAQRQAAVYAKSTLVPKEYQNNIGNVLIATNMARRLGADALMVMQHLYIVHGRPGWSAQFLIATFNQCGRFGAIKYRMAGEPGKPGSSCTAYTTEIATGERIEGATITWEMATAEGWVNKSGSKWKSMPEQMFRYRAAVFLIRTTAPEIGMGLQTVDEIEDIAPREPREARSYAATLEAVAGHIETEPQEEAPIVTDEQKLSEFHDRLTQCTTQKACIDLEQAYDFASDDAQAQASAWVAEHRERIKAGTK